MISDAIVQLDEGLQVAIDSMVHVLMMIVSLVLLLLHLLQNLSTIKDVQLVKDSDAWAELPDDIKKSHDDRLREATMYAKNRNVLALKTVHTLELITKFITG